MLIDIPSCSKVIGDIGPHELVLPFSDFFPLPFSISLSFTLLMISLTPSFRMTTQSPVLSIFYYILPTDKSFYLRSDLLSAARRRGKGVQTITDEDAGEGLILRNGDKEMD